MVEKRILIVEGNTREENSEFSKVGINTHTESLIESINFYNKNLEIDIANPSSDSNLKNSIDSLDKYDGLIWGGSSLNIYNDTEEIRRQLDFMRECQNKIKNVMSLRFNRNISDIWGIQYHPEITYEKMVSLIHFRKERLINKGAFKNQGEINDHVSMIENEIKVTEKKSRMRELENWLNYLYEN